MGGSLEVRGEASSCLSPLPTRWNPDHAVNILLSKLWEVFETILSTNTQFQLLQYWYRKGKLVAAVAVVIGIKFSYMYVGHVKYLGFNQVSLLDYTVLLLYNCLR